MALSRTTYPMNADFQRYCREREEGDQPLPKPPAGPTLTSRVFDYDGQAFVPR